MMQAAATAPAAEQSVKDMSTDEFLAFTLGKRKGKKKRTIVEVRRV